MLRLHKTLRLILILLFAYSSYAETISFETVLQQALAVSYETKIAEADKEVSLYVMEEAYSSLFPVVSLVFTNEYTHDSKHFPGLYTIQGKYYTDNTQWQSTLSLNVQYDLLNPKGGHRAYYYALDNYLLSQITLTAVRKSIAMTVIDVYERALSAYHSVEIYNRMIETAAEIYTMQKRLSEAGVIDKRSYLLSGVFVADYTANKLESERTLKEALAQLGYFSKITYTDTAEMEDFPDYPDLETTPSIESYPEAKLAAKKIEQKEKEIDIHNNIALMPTITLFGSMNYYGNDRGSFIDSQRDSELKNYIAGVSVRLVLFEGLSFIHTRMRLNAEREKLILERNQTRARLTLERERLIRAKGYLKETEEELNKSAILVKDSFAMGERLREHQIAPATDILREQLDVLEKMLEQKQLEVRLKAENARLNVIGRY